MLTLLYGGHINGDGVGTAVDGCLNTEEVGLMVGFEEICVVTPASSVPSLVWNLSLDVYGKTILVYIIDQEIFVLNISCVKFCGIKFCGLYHQQNYFNV